jgi:Ala-tRNA(Pro) deacylase
LLAAAQAAKFGPMPALPEDLFSCLEGLDIQTATHTHAPVYTVNEAKTVRGGLPGGHSKNLFLKDKKGALWLVVAEEDLAINMKGLRRSIGAAQLSFGRPELLLETLGIEPGSVTPFAVINDHERLVTVVLDSALLTHDPLNFHPLTNAATTSISPDDLIAFLRAEGHDPLILDLSTTAPE